MEKMFSAATLIFLAIVSLTAMTQGPVFNYMPLFGDIQGFKAPAQEAFNLVGMPLVASFLQGFTAGSSPLTIGGSSASLDNPTQTPGLSFVDNPPAVSASSSPVAEDTGSAPAMSSGYRLHDTFDSLRSDLWTVSSYKPDSDTLTTTFTPSSVWSADGRLALRSTVADNTGGEYKSNDRFYLGKYRASINVDQVPGTYLTFFAYVWPSDGGNNVHNEIDIELIINHGKATAMLSTWRDYAKTQHLYVLPFDPSEGYHTYGFDWFAGRVEFYIDDMATPVWTSRSNIPQDPMYVYFNSWVDKNPPASQRNGVSTEYVDWVTVE